MVSNSSINAHIGYVPTTGLQVLAEADTLYSDVYTDMTKPGLISKRIMDNNTSQNAPVLRYTSSGT